MKFPVDRVEDLFHLPPHIVDLLFMHEQPNLSLNTRLNKLVITGRITPKAKQQYLDQVAKEEQLINEYLFEEDQ